MISDNQPSDGHISTVDAIYAATAANESSVSNLIQFNNSILSLIRKISI